MGLFDKIFGVFKHKEIVNEETVTEKVISNNISSKLKGLLKSPHRYIIRFTLLGEDKYKLEIIRYKKLNISTTQKLSSLQILHHINKEESTEEASNEEVNKEDVTEKIEETIEESILRLLLLLVLFILSQMN